MPIRTITETAWTLYPFALIYTRHVKFQDKNELKHFYILIVYELRIQTRDRSCALILK